MAHDAAVKNTKTIKTILKMADLKFIHVLLVFVHGCMRVDKLAKPLTVINRISMDDILWYSQHGYLLHGTERDADKEFHVHVLWHDQLGSVLDPFLFTIYFSNRLLEKSKKTS